jgi:methyltransferase (TIGR00027 family)
MALINDSSNTPLLASTARWTAAVRAHESARPDSLFKDPYAASLAGDEGAAWLAARSPDKFLPIAVRTRYFDDFLTRTLQETTLRQVVLLAAGLDTRAYRLDWPLSTRLFEIDQPDVLAYKEEVLGAMGARPGCARQGIGLDLRGPWKEALLEKGFDSQRPAVWLLEGFLFYLETAELTRLLDEVCAFAAPGSWMGFDIINSLTLTHPLTRAWIEMQAQAGAPWIGALDDPEAFLKERGWQAFMTQIGQPDAIYGRQYPAIPVRMAGIPHNWYVTARKGDV